MKIRNVVHKGLKRLYAEDVTKGVPSDTVDKLRKMLTFLDDMRSYQKAEVENRNGNLVRLAGPLWWIISQLPLCYPLLLLAVSSRAGHAARATIHIHSTCM